MSHDFNHLGQPIGPALPEWKAPPHPPREPMMGRTCRVEPLDPDLHGADLYAANAFDVEGRNWTYLPVGPFSSQDEYMAWMRGVCTDNDPLFHAIVESRTGRAVGVASYLRIAPQHGSIEVGHINYSPLLQRTVAATEAMYLLMKRAFDLGYRRYEWKCDSLNAPSRAAAQRLGFSYEGTFRQAVVYKGRSRDTAWYAAIDREWPELDAAFRRWLDPSNFDAQGQQRIKLSILTGPILKQRG